MESAAPVPTPRCCQETRFEAVSGGVGAAVASPAGHAPPPRRRVIDGATGRNTSFSVAARAASSGAFLTLLAA